MMSQELTGIALDSLPDVLVPVADEHSARPLNSFSLLEVLGAKGPVLARYMKARRGETFDFTKNVHHLPVEAFQLLDVDHAAKLAASTDCIMLDESITKYLETNAVHLLVHKLRSSAWRWGFSRLDWNDTVASYNGLRSFSMGVDGLEATLDHTRWHHYHGHAEHSGTYLDGAFAYLVHYKGEHVMTIGFSIVGDRRLLLQQVQLKNAKGNRWLFKMAANRVEHVIDRLLAAFPGFTLFIADGADIGKDSLDSYKRSAAKAKEMVKRYRTRLAANDNADTTDLKRYIKEAREEASRFTAKAKALKADLPRLQALYANSGRHAQGDAWERNGIRHYRIAA